MNKMINSPNDQTMAAKMKSSTSNRKKMNSTSDTPIVPLTKAQVKIRKEMKILKTRHRAEMIVLRKNYPSYMNKEIRVELAAPYPPKVWAKSIRTGKEMRKRGGARLVQGTRMTT